jgi:hypothetical protein
MPGNYRYANKDVQLAKGNMCCADSCMGWFVFLYTVVLFLAGITHFIGGLAYFSEMLSTADMKAIDSTGFAGDGYTEGISHVRAQCIFMETMAIIHTILGIGAIIVFTMNAIVVKSRKMSSLYLILLLIVFQLFVTVPLFLFVQWTSAWVVQDGTAESFLPKCIALYSTNSDAFEAGNPTIMDCTFGLVGVTFAPVAINTVMLPITGFMCFIISKHVEKEE